MSYLSPEYRAGLNERYQDFILRAVGYKLPAAESAADLIAHAKKCANPPFEAELGLRTEPPFPGAMEPPEEMRNGWRAICASRIFKDDLEVGVIFTTFYSGRPVASFINGPTTMIPDFYKPVAEL